MNKELRRFERLSIERRPERSLCCWQPFRMQQTSTNAPSTQPPPACTREKGDAGNLNRTRNTSDNDEDRDTEDRHAPEVYRYARHELAVGLHKIGDFPGRSVETDNALRGLTDRVTIKNDRKTRMLRQENEARDPLEKRQRFPGPCPLERVGAPAFSHRSSVPGATLYDAFVQMSGRETGEETPELPDGL